MGNPKAIRHNKETGNVFGVVTFYSRTVVGSWTCGSLWDVLLARSRLHDYALSAADGSVRCLQVGV